MYVIATYQHHDPDPPVGGDGNATSADAAAMAAMDAALADQPMPDIPDAPAPVAKETPAATDPPKLVETPPAEVDPFAAAVAETPEAKLAREKAAADAEAAKGKKPGEVDPAAAPVEKTPEEKLADERKAKIDGEVDALKAELKAEGKELSPKGEERFRALAQVKAEYEPIAAVMTKTGIKDAAQLELVVGDAQAGHQMLNRVLDTGADHVQYGLAMNYLGAANKALGGDIKGAEACWGWLIEELKTMGGILGREIPGIVDPIAEHADLVADLRDEKITRERALEVARGRTADKRAADARAAGEQVVQQTQQQTAAYTAAVDTARAQLNALGNELAASDPGGVEAYKAKGPALLQLVKDTIAANKDHPELWAQKVATGYLKLKAPAAAVVADAGAGAGAGAGSAVRKPDDQGPLRSAGPTGALVPEFDSPEAALDAAIADADRYGRGSG